jgi:CheY-like chemotaxis protein
MPPENNRNGATGLAWLRNKRVLLAEDNITNQMVATQMLDALGAQVDVANDGAEALEMIEVKPYDLYLIDIEMPRVSGLDVIRSIRNAAPPLCNATVIAVTAYALREHREKITEAGADGLIPKPLVGIEQFGRDILSFADLSREGVEAPVAVKADPRKATPATNGPVAADTYQALADAIGPEAMADLLGKIDADLAKAESEIRSGAADHDKAVLSGASHVLISVAGAIGAEKLQKLAQRLNAAVHGRGGEDVSELSPELLKHIEVLRAFIGKQIATSGG